MTRQGAVLMRLCLALIPLLAAMGFLVLPVAPASPSTVGSVVSARRIAYEPPHHAQSAQARRRALGSGNLLWNGGPVQHNPAAYVIFWGAQWATSANTLNPTGQLIQKYFADVGGSALERILTQYHDGAGPIGTHPMLAGMTIDTRAPATDTSCNGPTVEDAAIQNEVLQAVQALKWPAPSADTTYFVYTPSHVFINDGTGACSQRVFCAYHAWSTTTPAFAYAALPYPDDAGCQAPHSPNHNLAADSLISTTSHEQFEAITDPQVGSGWMDAASYEIADKCYWDFSRGYTRLQNGGRFELQTQYSNASRTCTNTYTPPAPPRPRRHR